MASSGVCTDPELKDRLDKNNLSNWHSKKELPAFNCLLRDGDIVQIMHSDSTVWAICTDIGQQPMVVHHKDGIQTGHWSVVKEDLSNLVGGGKVRINNARDNVSKPKDVSDILQSALEAIGKVFPVSDVICHCGLRGGHGSHFVESIRYSEQDIKNRLDSNNVSKWYAEDDLPVFNWLLRAGDIVQFREFKNMGWAICTEMGIQPMVVRREDKSHPGHWSVGKEALAELIGGGLVRINNSRDKVSKPKDVRDIVQSALKAVGNVADGLTQCDQSGVHGSHFVESMRYSEQDIESRLDKNNLSQWYAEDELPAFNWLLRNGDIVQSKNSLNIGWAICTEIGLQPTVVHQIVGLQTYHWSAVKEVLSDLVGGGQVRINNARDNKSKPKDVSDILRLAAEAVGKVGDGLCQCGQRGAHGSHFVESMRYSERDIKSRLRANSTSEQYSKEELPTFYWLLRKGDIVFIQNPSCGFAICVEEPHTDPGCPSLVLPAFVLEELSDLGKQPDTMVSCNFDVFRQDVKFQICNGLDLSCRPRSVEDILKIANGEIGKTVSGAGNRYKTCEEFVDRARYNR